MKHRLIFFKIKIIKRLFVFECFLLIFFLIFSNWLFWSTFKVDAQNNQILIDTKLWSDFGSHLPLIRSFSLGTNFPPEYPIFSGEPTKYHFLFYALVGLLERVGVRLDVALNTLSMIGFLTLLVTIFFLAKLLFKSKTVGILTIIFFLFNGSLSFLEFFKIHPLSLETPREIFNNVNFPSFGPYDGKIVSAFWNLNIYTNQRHLAFAYAWVLILVLIFLRIILHEKKISTKNSVFLGLILGMLPLFHSGVFSMGLLIFSLFFLLFKNYRLPLLFFLLSASVLGLPQMLFLKSGLNNSMIHFHPGYLIAGNLNFFSFLNYWLLNLGLGFLFIPIGFLLSNQTQKKVLIAFSSLFLIANVFQFSPEMAANHKFFNLWLIIGNMFSAWAIVWLWQQRWTRTFLIIVSFLFVFSGIIDFFAIKNDSTSVIVDTPANPDILWIKNNTLPEAIFLNSSYFLHPASLAGRRIFLGWPYFPWSVGYDVDTRSQILKEIYKGNNLQIVCQSLKNNKINYITTEEPQPESEFEINYDFFRENFPILYQNPSSHNFSIYEVKETCDSS
ncbi:hypothetical protein A2Z23_03010 [Candidatus Curtissbacteria bacterium RBG_16_39_7]|uniref:Glycosyltransferase RgtA/B/C/D-like domain-containing protein n=1 Tax=Candidatus Curtissbacteria bacterium RBG_16_39_7 TaxID=1797707 RepID=A0A1F5G479_9BACT|nr:MAG: hypothetical protein A2Z23_03010 [Candidatus Curtissbacteria bacterium RBG_16_39_7]